MGRLLSSNGDTKSICLMITLYFVIFGKIDNK